MRWLFARKALDSPELGVSRFTSEPEGLDVLCVGGRRPDGGDGEMVDGFWG